MTALSAASSRATLPSALRIAFRTEFAAGRLSPSPLHQHNLRLLPNRYPGSVSCHNLRNKRLYSTPSQRPSHPHKDEPSSAPKRPQKKGPPKDKTTSRDPKWGRAQPSPKRERKGKKDPKPSRSKRPSRPPPEPQNEEEGRDGKGPVLWKVQKDALKEKFGETGWQPQRKLSPDAMDGIRQLHATDPKQFSTPVLANHFKISPEAIRRILKATWQPTEQEMDRRRARWHRRYHRIWGHMTQLGLRGPRSAAKPYSDAGVLYGDGKDPFQ